MCVFMCGCESGNKKNWIKNTTVALDVNVKGAKKLLYLKNY